MYDPGDLVTTPQGKIKRSCFILHFSYFFIFRDMFKMCFTLQFCFILLLLLIMLWAKTSSFLWKFMITKKKSKLKFPETTKCKSIDLQKNIYLILHQLRCTICVIIMQNSRTELFGKSSIRTPLHILTINIKFY